ncbi:MAG TPA: hypothetical protein VL588_07780, partial [Bdellovibrionota bacterium]|nr:hypothetical protein [Bdellovibrionota bacterium]
MAVLSPTVSRLETVKVSSREMPRLRDLLAKFSGMEILVVGDVGVDRYTQGTVERISPEAPVPIVAVE